VKSFIDPALDFSDGLRVLYDYHDDFLLQGQHLLELWGAMCKQGVDEGRAAQSIELTNYYTHATRLHHLDEERCLFPRILNKSFRIDGMIERLALDHEEIEALWAELVHSLQMPGRADPVRCLASAQQFEQQLRAHIERENLDFLPEVEKLLSLEQRMEMGRAMEQRRRQVDLAPHTRHETSVD
jgi:hemerythrin-like domain-containing protein